MVTRGTNSGSGGGSSGIADLNLTQELESLLGLGSPISPINNPNNGQKAWGSSMSTENNSTCSNSGSSSSGSSSKPAPISATSRSNSAVLPTPTASSITTATTPGGGLSSLNPAKGGKRR